MAGRKAKGLEAALKFVEKVKERTGNRLLMAVLFGSALSDEEGGERRDVDVLLVHCGKEGPFREAVSRAWMEAAVSSP